MRKLVIGVAAIAAFTAAALVAIWLATRSGPAAPGASAPVAPRAEIAAAPPAPPPALGTPLAPQTPGPPPVMGPPPPEPPKGSWEAIPVVARPSALGPLAGAIGRGLIELQPQLAACFDEDTAARYGTRPVSVAKDASTGSRSTPVLILQIETGGDEARIVDAPVDSAGSASDGVIACAQSVLRGRRFPAPGAPAGARYRMTQPLFQ